MIILYIHTYSHFSYNKRIYQTVRCLHTQAHMKMPTKRKSDIFRHIKKVISEKHGRNLLFLLFLTYSVEYLSYEPLNLGNVRNLSFCTLVR